MNLRFDGDCYKCFTHLPKGQKAVYDSSIKKVRCETCENEGVSEDVVTLSEQDLTMMKLAAELPPDTFVYGEAGAAARREYSKRKTNRENRIKDAHPKLGKVILALSDEPQHQKAWATGAVGEERLAVVLNGIASEKIIIFHDRKIPKSTANIDHMAITPAGIWVIDAKRYKGRPEKRTSGGLFSPKREDLIVNGRTQNKLVEGVKKQMALVEKAINYEVPVRGALCFVNADWPLIGGNFIVSDIQCLWPKKLASVLKEESTYIGEKDPIKLAPYIAKVFKSYK